MGGGAVEDLDLPPSVKDRLRRQGMLYVRDLTEFSPKELAEYLEIEDSLSLEILRAADAIAPFREPANAYNALKEVMQENGVVTFVKGIDDMLGSGVAIGSITEFAGTPGVGKTQLAMQLCIDVQIPHIFHGLGGRAVYIDTEGSFCDAVDRVAQMAESVVTHLKRTARHRDGSTDDVRAKAAAEVTVEGLLGGIDCYRAHNRAELLTAVAQLDGRLAADPSIKLVVIDSVAFPFRAVGSTSKDATKTRDRELQDLARDLHRLALERSVAVVVTNHLGLRFDKGTQAFLLSPTLGEVWHHGVSTRVLCFQQPRGDSLGTGHGLPHCRFKRVAQLVKSTRHKAGSASFRITREGVRGDDASSSSSTATTTATAAHNINGKRPLPA